MSRKTFVYRNGKVVEKAPGMEPDRPRGPMLSPDYQPYDCPITGKIIDGRYAHRENLARHGCRVLEKGEKEAAERDRERSFNDRMDRILSDMA